LLRFPVSKAWKITLWILIAIQVVMPIGANIFALLQCRPVRAQWSPCRMQFVGRLGSPKAMGIYTQVGSRSRQCSTDTNLLQLSVR
jgi:hypothetical protein